METIKVKRISAGSFYKLLVVGCLGIYFLIGLFALVLSIFGLLDSSNSYWTNILASLAVIIFALIFAPFLAAILWLTLWPVIWLYSWIRPMKISYFKPGLCNENRVKHSTVNNDIT